MPRQGFGDFLNSASPGRGRGRGRGGGRGRGRGGFDSPGRGRGGRTGRGGHFGADYSNVALDYASVNSKQYNRFEQTSGSVQPFGERRGRGRGGWSGPHQAPGAERSQARPSRGRGLGFETPNTSASASGAATPITGGLGYHRRSPRVRVDKFGVVTWGGGIAPLFVKSGELFKEGEVDVVRREGDTFVIEHYPLSDPSAPQMRDLEDGREVEIAEGTDPREVLRAVAKSHGPQGIGGGGGDVAWPTQEDFADLNSVEFEGEEIGEEEFSAMADQEPLGDEDDGSRSEDDVDAILSEKMETTLLVDDGASTSIFSSVRTERIVYDASSASVPDTPSGIAVFNVNSQPPLPPTALDIAREESQLQLSESTEAIVDVPDQLDLHDTAAAPDEPIDSPEDDSDLISESGEEEVEDDNSHLFFVDTTGDAAAESSVLYDTSVTAHIGIQETAPDQEDDEEAIVFKPRLITDPVASSSRHSGASSHGAFELTSIRTDPRVSLNRKDRKAAKKEKRARNKRRGRKGTLGGAVGPRDDSDIDWGSDGPPNVLDIDSADSNYHLHDDEIDPELDLEVMRRFGQGMDRIQQDESAMAYMESESDEYSDIDEDVKARHQAPPDPFGLEEGSAESESESGSDDFEALAAAYDSDGKDDDEFEEEGEAKLFTGGSGWNEYVDDEEEDEDEDDEEEAKETDTDWFIRSMENALDGGAMALDRKERNRTFRSVANGSFDLPTGKLSMSTMLTQAPAKKDKKGSHIPPELQDQWLRDRAKKAEKKQEREMARALALIDPFSHKGKGKKKKFGKAEAARNAHLIPASAAEVAEMFDIPSEDDFMSRKRGAHTKTLALLPDSLATIDAHIQRFLTVPGHTTLALGPMPKEQRKRVHMLAECYGLKSKSKGKGTSRAPVLIKLARSGLRDENTRDRLVSSAKLTGGKFYKAVFSGSGGGGKKHPPRGTGASVRAREGDLVGEGAEKIGQDNVGHKLLSMMGWSEGASIGRTAGLDVPIVAVVKNTKSGLGA